VEEISLNMTPNAFSILTPRGEGGLGIIRLKGPAAESFLVGAFRTVSGRRISSIPQGRLILGSLEREGVSLDEVMLTGITEGAETEIQCHGGHQSIRRISDYLVACEFVESNSSEFAFSQAKNLDAIQHEAEVTIPEARSPLALSLLLSQSAGALSAFVGRILAGESRADEVEKLLAPPRLGEVLCNPPRVVLAGPPNAGKSSLFNAMVGRNRVIIAGTPGTTRDAIEEEILLDGIPIRLIDTAGLRETDHPIESAAIEVSGRQLEESAVVLFVVDGTQEAGDQVISTFEAIQVSKPAILVSNKSDLFSVSCSTAGGIRPVHVSAKTGEGMDNLTAALLDTVVLNRGYVAGDPAIFTSRQADLFIQILKALKTENQEIVSSLGAKLLNG
jgi:tRNA modification GTPase